LRRSKQAVANAERSQYVAGDISIAKQSFGLTRQALDLNQENINFNKKMLVANTIIQGTQAAISLTNAAIGLGNAIFENKQRASLQAQRGNIAQVNAEIRQADIDGFNPYDENQNYVGYDGYVTRNGRTIGDMKAEITQGVGEHFKTQWATNRALENINNGFIDIELNAQMRLMERESAITDKLMLSDLSDLKDTIIRGEVQYDLNGNEKNAETSVRDILVGYSMPESQRELLTRQFVDDVNIAKVRRDAENIATSGGGYAAAEAHIRASGLSDDQEADLIKNMTQEHAVTMKGFEDHIQQIINQGRESGLSSSAISASLAGLAEKQTDPQKVDRINTYRNQLNNDKLELFNQQFTNAVDKAVKGDRSDLDALYERAIEEKIMSPEQLEALRIKTERELIPDNIQNEVLRIGRFNGTEESNKYIETELTNGNISEIQAKSMRADVTQVIDQMVSDAETKCEEVFNEVFKNTQSVEAATTAALNTGSENADVNQAVSRRVDYLQKSELNNEQAKRLFDSEYMSLETLKRKRDEILNSEGKYINQRELYRTHLSQVNNLIANREAEIAAATKRSSSDISSLEIALEYENNFRSGDMSGPMAMAYIYGLDITESQRRTISDRMLTGDDGAFSQFSMAFQRWDSYANSIEAQYKSNKDDAGLLLFKSRREELNRHLWQMRFQAGDDSSSGVKPENMLSYINNIIKQEQADHLGRAGELRNWDQTNRDASRGELDYLTYNAYDTSGNSYPVTVSGGEELLQEYRKSSTERAQNILTGTGWQIINNTGRFEERSAGDGTGRILFDLENNGNKVTVSFNENGDLIKQDGTLFNEQITQGRDNTIRNYHASHAENFQQQIKNAVIDSFNNLSRGHNTPLSFYETVNRVLDTIPKTPERDRYSQYLFDDYGTDEWRRRMNELFNLGTGAREVSRPGSQAR